jgi:hypothetical protein
MALDRTARAPGAAAVLCSPICMKKLGARNIADLVRISMMLNASPG